MRIKSKLIAPVISIFFLAGFLFGCDPVKHSTVKAEPLGEKVKESEPPNRCPDLSEIEPLHLVGVLIDRSGSVWDLDKGAMILADLSEQVRQLPPSTFFFARFISDQSYRDGERIVADFIPQAPPEVDCEITNPFDPRQKIACAKKMRDYKAMLGCVEKARERIITKLKSIRPTRASRTDLWGGIAAVAETLNAYPTHYKMILVYSDSADNVATPLPSRLPGLKGAEVVLRSARTESPLSNDSHFSAFSARLSTWGAEARYIPLEVPIRVKFGQAQESSPQLSMILK